MKHIGIILAIFLAAVACTRETPTEITQLDLARCLMPTQLDADVENEIEVTFEWQVNKDAESFNFEYSENENFESAVKLTVKPDDVPLELTLEHSKTYYYRVQATAKGKEPSKWGVCTEPVTTF